MNTRRTAFPAFLLGSAVLSAGPLLVRLSDVGAMSSAFWRVALALPALFLLTRALGSGSPAPVGRLWPWLALAGAFFAADLAAWHLGIGMTTLANAALFANSTSFFYPVYGYVVARTLPSRRAAAALLLAFLGVAFLMGLSAEISAAHLAGDLLCILAGLFYTGYFVVMDRSRGRLDAWPALLASTFFAALALLPVALLSGDSLWPRDWTPLVALALGSQVVGQGLIIFALPHLSPLASGLGLLVQPLLSAMLGWIWFGEELGPAELLGMTAILLALVLVRLPERSSTQ